MAKPIPERYHTVTPHLVVQNANAAIEFYAQAFGAEELGRMPMPDGRVMHAELKIGDSVVMLADEMDWGGGKSPLALGGNHSSLLIYTSDVDALFARATAAGATVEMPLGDQFWGDRYGKVRDPFGHSWALATHIEDLSPEQMQARAKQAMQAPQG